MANHAILTADDHRELRIDPTRGAALGDGVMSCLVVPGEFRRVQSEYPILFRRTPERDRFQALAMFGFEAGENLFLGDRGWDAHYLPLAMRIQPFLIGGSPGGGGDRQIHVDLDSPRIATGGDGVRVFDELGRATPYLEAIAGYLGELEAGWRPSEAFFAALERHELIEPLTLEITMASGAVNRLVGYHSVNEDRLQGLGGADLADLHSAGHLLPIFMALASLSNVARLIARMEARIAHG